MILRKFNPTTPGVRHRIVLVRELSKEEPYKSLVRSKKSNAGRSNQGKVTIRHRGGGVKRNYRIIDVKRDKIGVEAVVDRIEYDPNRSADIALLKYSDGVRKYILAPEGLKIGAKVISGPEVEVNVGNALPVGKIPSGTTVHSVEVMPGAGGKLGRSAGQKVVVRGNDGKGYTILKLPSGEVRLVNEKCMATIGTVGNAEQFNRVLGKAGVRRRMGWRPSVRGVVMHPGQHPQGGGEAKCGKHTIRDIWGHRIGTKTRKNKRTAKFIIKGRAQKGVGGSV